MNWADLMAAQGAFGTDFYERSILRPKHRAYYRSGRPVIKIDPKGALGSHEIRPIHSAPSLGHSITLLERCRRRQDLLVLQIWGCCEKTPESTKWRGSNEFSGSIHENQRLSKSSPGGRGVGLPSCHTDIFSR